MHQFLNNSRKVTIFCPNYNVIYSRVNKVASTTIDRNVLDGKRVPYRGMMGKNLPPDMRYLYDSWDGWVSFSFVRNPWDRIVSAYAYLSGRGYLSGWRFEEFVTKMHRINERVIMDHIIPCHFSTHHKGEQVVDFIGRLENFDNDIKQVLPMFGRSELPPVTNQSNRDDYRSYYNEETRRRVEELYAKDIEYYGYDYGHRDK